MELNNNKKHEYTLQKKSADSTLLHAFSKDLLIRKKMVMLCGRQEKSEMNFHYESASLWASVAAAVYVLFLNAPNSLERKKKVHIR